MAKPIICNEKPAVYIPESENCESFIVAVHSLDDVYDPDMNHAWLLPNGDLYVWNNGNFVPVIETYDGVYEYTITDNDIVVPIKGLKAEEDIVVHQGAEGVEIYGGPYSVTVNSDITLSTNGKRMVQDLELLQGHEIEDALIQNTPMDEYFNDRVTTIGISGQNDVFSGTQIKKISFPNATSCPASYAFHGRNISLLEELYLPKLRTSGYGCMENNPNLRVCDFGFTFGGAKCRYCPNLEVLIIRDTALKNVGSGWLTGCTKMLPDGTGGYVYVPQALLSQYEASQAWQDYANVLEFRPIEGSEYELEE